MTEAAHCTCAACKRRGQDVAVRRSKGKQLLCGSCFADSIDARVRSSVVHRFARAERPWAQHVVGVGVSGSQRSLALLAALVCAVPAEVDRSFRVQPIYVLLGTAGSQEEQEATVEQLRQACKQLGSRALVVVDVLPSDIKSHWAEIDEEARTVMRRTALVAGLEQGARAADGRALCLATAETAETLAARCLELTACARGGSVAELAPTASTDPAGTRLPLLRPFGDLLDSEVSEYASVRAVRAVRASHDPSSAVHSVCAHFCDEMQRQFDHTAFAVVSTASKLTTAGCDARCALCAAPYCTKVPREAAALCFACGQLRARSSSSSTAAALECFMERVTAPLLARSTAALVPQEKRQE